MNQAQIEKLILAVAITAGVTAVLFLLRTIVLKLLGRWASATKSKFDDVVIDVIRGPSLYLCFALGLYAALEFSAIGPRYIIPVRHTINVIIIMSLSFAAANLVSRIFRVYMHEAHSPLAKSGLANGLLKMGVLWMGALTALSVLGISITPLLTALGVGGLAVALAFKDTLENLFGGIYLLTDGAIRVGDFVALDNGMEGTVEDIGWRTTRVRLAEENMLILPNVKLAQSVVTNYYLPVRNLGMPIVFNVEASTDLQRLEDALMKIIGQGAEDIAGLLTQPVPSVKFQLPATQTSIEVTLVVFVREPSVRGFVRRELIKRIQREFIAQGFRFPDSSVTLKTVPGTT